MEFSLRALTARLEGEHSVNQYAQVSKDGRGVNPHPSGKDTSPTLCSDKSTFALWNADFQVTLSSPFSFANVGDSYQQFAHFQ